MSKTSQDPTKYYRTGIALALHRKPEFDKRLNELGIKTVGDLVLMFTLGDGVVEALKPVAERYLAERNSTRPVPGIKVKDVTQKLKGMNPEQLAKVMALVEEQANSNADYQIEETQ